MGQEYRFGGRVHLLGMWRDEWFRPYPATSGDSTTWIPRGPYNRSRSVAEWLKEYGEREIPYEPPVMMQAKLGV